MRARLVLAIGIIPVVLVMASASFADPNLPNVTPHRHWLGDPANGVQIGPKVCDNPNVQQAFNQFHNNAHIATPASIGKAAPGLHNGHGGEIRATLGCGMP
jgi:hypothetical protein